MSVGRLTVFAGRLAMAAEASPVVKTGQSMVVGKPPVSIGRVTMRAGRAPVFAGVLTASVGKAAAGCWPSSRSKLSGRLRLHEAGEICAVTPEQEQRESRDD